MDRVTKIIGHDPLTVIEFITALTLVVGGLYLLSPFLDISIAGLEHASPVVRAAASSIGVAALGIICTITGAVHIFGIWKYKYKVRSAAMFTHIMIRMYALIITLILQHGIFPMDWIQSFWMMLIIAICYLVVRRKIRFLSDVKRNGP